MLVADSAVIVLGRDADVSGLNRKIQGYDSTPWDSETWNIADWRREP